MALTTVLSVFTLLYYILAICHAQQTCPEWTQWMDDENGGTLEPSSIGEFEQVDQLRGAYGFCDEPTDIECALADDTNTPYDGTGQDSLTCNLQQGFRCFHSNQNGDCFSYAIRLLCAEPLKEDSKHVCVDNDGQSFEFSCTFLDSWTVDFDDKSSCQHSNAIVDISDVIYGIFNASTIADVIECIERPQVSKVNDSAMAAKISVAFSKDAKLTEDEVITAFTEAATRRNQDASLKFKVDTTSAITVTINKSGQSGTERQRGSLYGLLAALITVVALVYM
ncbi:uncharacterized protein [Ptychodera flava]|uniref:uncharacterized protein n=1 Tax=Ptychodera flava TaxID=63121 RepID=UPI003969F09C